MKDGRKNTTTGVYEEVGRGSSNRHRLRTILNGSEALAEPTLRSVEDYERVERRAEEPVPESVLEKAVRETKECLEVGEEIKKLDSGKRMPSLKPSEYFKLLKKCKTSSSDSYFKLLRDVK